jgi:ditrans,polycis-polyprenyl diphosphate synthase
MNILAKIQSFLSKVVTRCMIQILSCGPTPKHIAFVMDGNRRYARIRGLKAHDGHGEGFESLKRVCWKLSATVLTPASTRGLTILEQVLEVCLRLHVKCVTVYAFSIENFSRPKEEVDAIMDLAKTGLLALAREG